MRFSKAISMILILFSGFNLRAENFEVIDGVAHVTGKPSLSPSQARANWDTACDQWKAETKEINRDNLLVISCEQPACTDFDGDVTCSSDGTTFLGECAQVSRYFGSDSRACKKYFSPMMNA
jgi:hypothetical protein